MCHSGPMPSERPVGHQFEFIYDSETYLVEILDLETLRWTRTHGDSVGATDVERYVWSSVDEDRWLVTWIEATGLGLSSLVDVANRRLITHGNSGRAVFTNTGEVRPVS